MILAADNNGGRYNKVHRQTDDGIVISVAMGDSLLPISFRYEDYLGCIEESLLAGSFYPHKRLMRGDCGWRVENDSVDLLFSWNALTRHVDGFSSGPDGEYVETYHDEPNCAENVRICGLKGHRTKWYRKDREYWTPGQTLAGEIPLDPFAISMNTEYNSCCTSPALVPEV